jgi:hypothetical protein
MLGFLFVEFAGLTEAAQAAADGQHSQVGQLGPGRVDPKLLPVLQSGKPDELIDVDIMVAVPRLRRVAIEPTVTTMDVSEKGRAVLTHQGKAVTEAQLRVHAADIRKRVLGGLQSQLRVRQAAVDEAIRLSGSTDAVVSRHDGGFQVRLSRQRANEVIRRMGPTLRAALLPRSVQLDSDMNDVEKDMGVPQFALAPTYNMKGQGIGILHLENYSPYRQRPDLQDADIRLLSTEDWQPTVDGICYKNDECCSQKCVLGNGGVGNCSSPATATKATCHPVCWQADNTCKSDIRGQEHSTMVSMLVHHTAPMATEYFGKPTSPCMTFLGQLFAVSPMVFVGTQSFSYGVDLDACETDWDDFLAATRTAHFHSAGNKPNDEVGFPARAYNVIGVGGDDPSNHQMYVNSTYKNPLSGVEKPEILAPGQNVPLDTGWVRSGTSISAPLAAGFAADMMSGTAFFCDNPQVIKAYLIAGAQNVDGNAGFDNGAGAKDGAGRISYLDTYYNRWGKIWYYGDNNSWFGSSNKIVEHTTMKKGTHYTLAIAWLADGQYAADNHALNMRMKLILSKGSHKFEAYQEKNNFQLLDVVAPETGKWTVTIERTFNSGDGGVDLALTIGKHS